MFFTRKFTHKLSVLSILNIHQTWNLNYFSSCFLFKSYLKMSKTSALASLQTYTSGESSYSDNETTHEKLSKNYKVKSEVTLTSPLNLTSPLKRTYSMTKDDSPIFPKLTHKRSDGYDLDAKWYGDNNDGTRTYSTREDDSPDFPKFINERSGSYDADAKSPSHYDEKARSSNLNKVNYEVTFTPPLEKTYSTTEDSFPKFSHKRSSSYDADAKWSSNYNERARSSTPNKVNSEVTFTPSLKKTHSTREDDFPKFTHKRSSSYDVDIKWSNDNKKRARSSYHDKVNSEVTFTPNLKRTYSMRDDDSKFTHRRSGSYDVDRKLSSDYNERASTSSKERRSLPSIVSSSISQSTTDTPTRYALSDNTSRRNSFPLKLTPDSSKHYFHSSFTTDQTPYSPKDSYQSQKRFRSNLPFYDQSNLMTFESDYGFIDSHCHLDFLFQRQDYEESYKEYQKKHKYTYPKCYKGCLAIFCNPFTFSKKHIWKSFLEEENVWASFGCHPHNAKDYNDEVEDSLRIALEHPKVRALGEIGLDYSKRNYCMRNLQHETFKRQLRIALEKKLPLVIHCREAHEDGMAIMKKIVPKDYLIHLHCFTDTWEYANQWLQEFPNLCIGITNVVTFPSAESVHEVAKNIPLDRLLLETDAPYFVPKPLQRYHPDTRFSHPGMAIHVAAQIAALKEKTLEEVLCQTRRNTKRIYKI